LFPVVVVRVDAPRDRIATFVIYRTPIDKRNPRPSIAKTVVAAILAPVDSSEVQIGARMEGGIASAPSKNSFRLRRWLRRRLSKARIL
jgi:hypothetical protein